MERHDEAAMWDDMDWGEMPGSDQPPAPSPAPPPAHSQTPPPGPADPAPLEISVVPPRSSPETRPARGRETRASDASEDRPIPAAVQPSPLPETRPPETLSAAAVPSVPAATVPLDPSGSRMPREPRTTGKAPPPSEVRTTRGAPRAEPAEEVRRHAPAPSGKGAVHVPSSVVTLTLADAEGSEVVYTFESGFTVGRHRENDLVIRDRQVSARHAKFAKLADGRFELVDLGSSGGTYVNGEEVESRSLEDGDRIEFASVSAVFRYVAGSHVEDDEFEETLVVRKNRQPKPLSFERPPKRRIGMLSCAHADGGRSLLPVADAAVGIGRAEDNDFVIADGHVSNHHAKIHINADGEYEVVDLGSTCGTEVNGMSILRFPLSSGDRILFGAVECLFEIVEE